jgi:hypothetical protein
MPETNVATEPIVTPQEPVAQPKVEAPVTPKEDLVTRTSKVNVTPKLAEPTNEFGLAKEDYDKIQSDPVLSKFYKSMQSGFGQKTQEIAEMRKQYEAKIKDTSTWTPEKVSQIVNDKNFVNAAQQLMQSQAPSNWSGTQEEWSALNNSEKQRFQSLEQEVVNLKQQQYFNTVKAEDEKLKTRYANYAPDIVDTTIKKLVSKEQIATREDIWKVVDYESAIDRAYKLGLQDAKLPLEERVNANAIDGGIMNSPTKVEAPKKEESNSKAFNRIFMENLARFKGRNK